MKFSEYINYFKTAAINNKVLAHDPATHHTFYEIDIEDILNALKFQLKNKSMSLLIESPEPKPSDEKADNIRKLMPGAFVILQEAKMNSIPDRELILDATQEVAEDIVSKLLNDTKKCKQNATIQPRIIVDINSVRFQKVGPLLTNHFGWRVEFTFNSTFKLGLQLDETKWNNETKFSI